MDQAISFLAKEGKAQHIEFDPLRGVDVTLPQGYVNDPYIYLSTSIFPSDPLLQRE